MRVLTKSRFKSALECPTKLFYSNKPKYPSTKTEDTFLQSLAQGGFQVEELARMNYPDGVDVEGDLSNYVQLAADTAKLLTRDTVTIFEAAFLHENLFIRVDILHKSGNDIQLIEVKAKSISKERHENFLSARGGLKAEWALYLYDVAFQQFVIQQGNPSYAVRSSLMLVDKDAVATVDGLNQMFKVSKGANTRTGIVKAENLTLDALGDSLLANICVAQEMDFIYDGNTSFDEERTFAELV
jgi:hypothetical protein